MLGGISNSRQLAVLCSGEIYEPHTRKAKTTRETRVTHISQYSQKARISTSYSNLKNPVSILESFHYRKIEYVFGPLPNH